MARRSSWFVLVGLAGILECGMTVAHFALQWEWQTIRDFGTLPPQLHWAMFALNFSWSVLLAGVGLLVLLSAARGQPAEGSEVGLRRWRLLGGSWSLRRVCSPAASHKPLVVKRPVNAFPVLLVVLHFGALGVTPNHRKTVTPVSR